MYNGQHVSVVMPAYNESDGIAEVVTAFRRLSVVDEVIVADNNSRDGTATIAERAGARVVREKRQGYGHACRTALLAPDSGLVVLVESDSTFVATDIYKLLVYSGEFDCVFGTRTSKACIWTGANMGFFLRYGNWAVAKLLEYLHNGPCLTDVGCTYKLFRRDALEKISPYLTVGGSAFSPQLMYSAIRCGLRCVEVPLHYRSRLGQSKITGSFRKAFFLGLRMMAIITLARVRSFPNVGTCVDPYLIAELEGRGEQKKAVGHF